MSVAIGEFSAPVQPNSKRPASNYGPGISTTLAELMNGLQEGIVDPKSDYTVAGHYDLVYSGNTLKANVVAQLVDLSGQLVDGGEAVGEFVDNSTLAGLGGLSLSMPPLADPNEKNKILTVAFNQLENGENVGAIEETKVRPKSGSPYAVEILAISKSDIPNSLQQWSGVAPRTPRFEGGQPYVDLDEDEVYALRIYNEDSQDHGQRISKSFNSQDFCEEARVHETSNHLSSNAILYGMTLQ